jgi:hypothetical protein
MTKLVINKYTILKILIEFNFYCAVVLLISLSFLCFSDEYSLFIFNENLYGALDNNLRMIMIYLAITECVILLYCVLTKGFRLMMLVGFFLILMIGSMEFYGEINTVEIDDQFKIFFLYTGISHILYGVMADIEQRMTSTKNDDSYENS